ncbi:MAG: efflux RND transporter periplasmic adaptor subunit [Fimbriimonadia bacterium]|nr:efflux RND transporter periplasmic adaptor subunit [Fimbriimonadia bacterium]
MKTLYFILCLLLLVSNALSHGDEQGHSHGSDDQSAEPSPAMSQGSFILSHHDLKILDPQRKIVEGATVRAVIYRKGNPNDVIHRENNAYEPENGVYGSHMTYTDPGEYMISHQVTLPNGKELTVDFPVWVPAVGPSEEGQNKLPRVLWGITGGLSALLLLWGTYTLGKKSGKNSLTVLLIGVGLFLTGSGIVATASGEEEGHLHGPDGQHLAAPDTNTSSRLPLRAYPTADMKESAEQIIEEYTFILSIENEEITPDPDLVALNPEDAQLIGLKAVNVEARPVGAGWTTTGQVKPNPNGAVTVNAPIGGRVIQVLVLPGQSVQKGQSMFVIDSPEIAQAQTELNLAQNSEAQASAKLRASEESLKSAQARAAYLQAVFTRQKRLAEAGVFASEPVERARAAFAEAEAENQAAAVAFANQEAQVRRLEEGLAAGIVSRRDVETARADLEKSRAKTQAASQQLATARSAMEREQSLQQQGLRDAKELQQAEADYRASRSEVMKAQSELSSARSELTRAQNLVRFAKNRLTLLGTVPGKESQVTIKAPISGKIETRSVNVGETTDAGQTLCAILNVNTVWVESDVYEQDLRHAQVGQSVRIVADAFPDKPIDGTISFVGQQVHPETRAVQLRTVVRNPDNLLKPNMFVRVMISRGGGEQILAPAESVQIDGGASVVFIEESPGLYRRQIVQTGERIGDRVVIISGLKTPDKVVAQGSYQLLAKAKGR